MNRNHALLALRLVIAAIFLWHGWPKAIDPSAAMDKFTGMGLAPWLGPIVGWTEVVAGLALAAGFMHRWASAALTVIIIGALVTVQIPKGGVTAGLERDILILVSLIVLMMESRLAYSIGGRTQSE